MVADPEGNHINTAGLPSRKLPIMGKEAPHANLSGKEAVQFVRRSGERGFDERPITKLGVGNDTYKGAANCPLFSHLEGSLTEHEESKR